MKDDIYRNNITRLEFLVNRITFCNIKINLDTRLWNYDSKRMSLIADIAREQRFVNPSRACCQNLWECIYQLLYANFIFGISES
jgi:hypothetical protein